MSFILESLINFFRILLIEQKTKALITIFVFAVEDHPSVNLASLLYETPRCTLTGIRRIFG